MEELEYKLIKDIEFDLIVDARSPREFEHSHVSEAVNFYALNNSEHEEVGTMYKNISKHRAKVLGASYICKNAAKHLPQIEKCLKAGSKILIYCAKGGQRSTSLGIILSQIGYRVWKIKGGYKGYRNHILEFIEDEPKLNFITLFGNTGSGKTRLLKRLEPHIDLEALANHQGSTFGLIHGKQPSMKAFQNELFYSLESLKNEKICFIEGESRRIGNITLPKSLHDKMRSGISVEIVSSMEHRVARIVEEYEHISDEFFFTCMDKIKPYIEKNAREEIIKSYKSQEIQKVAFLLLENYYDKVYKKPSRVDFVVRFDDDMEKSLKELNAIKALAYKNL